MNQYRGPIHISQAIADALAEYDTAKQAERETRVTYQASTGWQESLFTAWQTAHEALLAAWDQVDRLWSAYEGHSIHGHRIQTEEVISAYYAYYA